MHLHELNVDARAHCNDSSAVLGSARYSFERFCRITRHCKPYNDTRKILLVGNMAKHLSPVSVCANIMFVVL